MYIVIHALFLVSRGAKSLINEINHDIYLEIGGLLYWPLNSQDVCKMQGPKGMELGGIGPGGGGGGVQKHLKVRRRAWNFSVLLILEPACCFVFWNDGRCGVGMVEDFNHHDQF